MVKQPPLCYTIPVYRPKAAGPPGGGDARPGPNLYKGDAEDLELLKPEQYGEADAFVSHHRSGSFMQSPAWAKVKPNWKHEIVARRGPDGKLKGTMSILIMPMGPGALMYAPRGPVCDYDDRDTLADLLAGAGAVAKKYHAHILKMDPYLLEGDKPHIEAFRSLGCAFTPDAGFKDTIQPRYNYMLPYLEGLTEEGLLAKFARETRYYIRYPCKHGVTCRWGDDCLDDFYKVYSETGERQGFNIRPKEYLAGFLKAFPAHARMYMCYSEQGAPICGGLAVNYAGKTAHVYGCSSDDHELRKLRATYLLQWEMMKWALSTGCWVYDMQGVAVRPEDSQQLYNVLGFKQNFTGEIVTTAGEFRIVYNAAVNAAMEAALKVRSKLAHR